MKTIRVGNGAGYWGDNLDAPRFLAEQGRLDYLTLEYLAELTLSILAHLKSRDPVAGYVPDFITVLQSLIPTLQSQSDLKIVTNAGGMNPAACARNAAEILAAAKLDTVPIAAVAGDDILADLTAHQAAGEAFENMDTGRPLSDVQDRLASANVYLGAGGIVDALAHGAQIVITGRVADASLSVGPAVHEFGWKWDDWPRLAAATVAGHLIECGAQVTGGMFSGWTENLSLVNLGYPIAELREDGGVCITKPPETGGSVTTETVAEQLVYEIGDPTHYLTPDVDADFSRVSLRQESADCVALSGTQGLPAPPRYKVSMSYRDGYMATGTLVVCGDQAEQKARVCGELILSRLNAAGVQLARTQIEILGTGDTLPGVWPRTEHAFEVLLRISAHDPSRETLERFVREFAPLAGSGPPGVTGYTGPRPKPTPVFAYWPTTIARNRVQPTMTVKTAKEWTSLS